MSTREKKRQKSNDGTPVALPVGSHALSTHTSEITKINDMPRDLFPDILSFLDIPDWVAASETSKEMCSIVRNSDDLWRRFLPQFPNRGTIELNGITLDEWTDPRTINGYENLTVFFQTKQLVEFREKIYAWRWPAIDEYFRSKHWGERQEVRLVRQEVRLERQEARLMRQEVGLIRRIVSRRRRPLP